MNRCPWMSAGSAPSSTFSSSSPARAVEVLRAAAEHRRRHDAARSPRGISMDLIVQGSAARKPPDRPPRARADPQGSPARERAGGHVLEVHVESASLLGQRLAVRVLSAVRVDEADHTSSATGSNVMMQPCGLAEPNGIKGGEEVAEDVGVAAGHGDLARLGDHPVAVGLDVADEASVEVTRQEPDVGDVLGGDEVEQLLALGRRSPPSGRCWRSPTGSSACR